MSTLGGILNTAKSAILVNQAAVQITAHNISNANTEGYSRQRAVLSAGYPLRTPSGTFGTGVRLDNVERLRDTLADQSVRRESGKAASFGTRSDLLGRVETIFGEPSETGIGSTLDRFWSSWSDLANTPTSNNARTMVRQRGEQVALALNGAAERLNVIEADVRADVVDTIGELNGLARGIAELNQQIVISETNGTTAGDLRDARDALVDQVAKIGNVRVVVENDGTYNVTLDGSPFVQGSSPQSMSADMGGGGLVVVRSQGQQFDFPREGSRLGAMVRFINEDIVNVRASLDQFASGLVTTVNGIHELGWTPTGAGVQFFAEPADPVANPITARNISLSAAVLADASVIAASDTVGATTDNTIALQLAALRHDPSTMPAGANTTSFAGYYETIVTGVALELRSAEDSTGVYETLAAQAEMRRQSYSGVSTDEELVKLIQFQQAYGAATRIVSTVDEMMQSLLNMV